MSARAELRFHTWTGRRRTALGSNPQALARLTPSRSGHSATVVSPALGRGPGPGRPAQSNVKCHSMVPSKASSWPGWPPRLWGKAGPACGSVPGSIPGLLQRGVQSELRGADPCWGLPSLPLTHLYPSPGTHWARVSADALGLQVHRGFFQGLNTPPPFYALGSLSQHLAPSGYPKGQCSIPLCLQLGQAALARPGQVQR